MKKVSVSLREEHLDTIEQRTQRGDAGSRSEAVREILEEYERLRTEYEDLHTEYEDLRTRLSERQQRIEQLETQLTRRSQLEQKIEDLPAKLTDELSYQEQRQRMLDEASIIKRVKWTVTGVPVEEAQS